MSGIKIRVGAALDSSAVKVFEPLEKAAERARRNIQKSLNAGGDVAAAERARTKAAEKWAKQREQIVRRSSEMAGRDAEKAANAEIRAREKANAAQLRAAEKAANAEIRVAEKAAAASARAAEKEGRRGGAIGIGRRAAISVSRGTAIAFGLGRSAAHAGLGLAESLAQGMGVDLSVASHMANAQETQQRLIDVTNAGYIQGAAGAQGVKQNTSDVRQDVYAAADAGAFAINDVAEGLQKFVGLTGDLATGRTILKETAVLARATGADFVSMAEASAEVSNHLGNVPNKAEQVAKVMQVIAGQGKMGALEIKDFARQMAKIAASAPRFEGTTAEVIGDLGLLAQETKMSGGAASASQAATSVMSFVSAFATPTTFKNWQKVGLNPYTDTGHTKLRSPEELILEALHSTKGNQTELQKLLPNVRAMRVVNPFASIYSETKGSDSDKLHAVAAEFDRMRAAQLNAEEVQKAYTEAMGTGKTAAQLANNKLDEMAATIQSALVPALADFAPALTKLMPLFNELAGGVATLLNQLTGASQKDAEDHAAALEGKLTDDQKLLAGSTGVIHGAGGDTKTYSGDVLDIIKAHGAKRSAASAELGTQMAAKEADAERWALIEKMDIGGIRAKAAHLVGEESAGEKAAADRAEAQRLRAEQEKATAEAAQSNEILANIYNEIKAGNAIEIRKPPAAAGAPGSGVAPADTVPNAD